MKKRFLAIMSAIALSVTSLVTSMAPSITAYAAEDAPYKIGMKHGSCYIGETNTILLMTKKKINYSYEEISAQYTVEKESDPDNIIESLDASETYIDEMYEVPVTKCKIKIRYDADPQSVAYIKITSKSKDGTEEYASVSHKITLMNTWNVDFSNTYADLYQGHPRTMTFSASIPRKVNGNLSYKWTLHTTDENGNTITNPKGFEISGENTSTVTVRYNGEKVCTYHTSYLLSVEVKLDGVVLPIEEDTLYIWMTPIPYEDDPVIEKEDDKAIDNQTTNNDSAKSKSDEVTPSDSKSSDNKSTENKPAEDKTAQNPAPQETPVLKAGEKVTTSTGESAKATKDGKSVVITKTSAKRSVKVPDKILVNGVEYPVTELAKKAITGKKVKNVTINAANLTKVDAKAFLGAKNLKTVKIVGVSKKSAIAKKIIKAAKKANKNVKIVFSK